MSSTAPVCLITGASSGIGAALAREFAQHGHPLVLVARRTDELARLADQIAASGHPRPTLIGADLAKPGSGAELADAIRAGRLEVSILVNNAGFGLLGEAAASDLASQLGIIDLNARAITDLTLRFLDSIVRHKGAILNVSSIAAFMPGPGMAVYHATKAYTLSFTEALHAELKGDGVKVCALCPGPVPTAFFHRAGLPSKYFPDFLARPADRVAREGYAGLMGGHRVVVPGTVNRIITVLPRLVPRWLVLAVMARRWRRHARGG